MNAGEILAQHDFIKMAQCKDLDRANDTKVKNLGSRKFYEPLKDKDTCKQAASLAVPALENLGLGILAAPSAAGLAGHPMNEKAKEVAEVGGLGVLAAHPTYELGHAAVNAIKGVPGQGTGLAQRAGQGIGNVVNKLRGATPVLSKLAYNSFYQEILK